MRGAAGASRIVSGGRAPPPRGGWGNPLLHIIVHVLEDLPSVRIEQDEPFGEIYVFLKVELPDDKQQNGMPDSGASSNE